MDSISNTNIEYTKQLITPNELFKRLPLSDDVKKCVLESRTIVNNIINGLDNRKLFIIGPCSIHNVVEAKKYGLQLKELSNKYKDKIMIVMRVYFEKPRTTVGWKGLINDPNLDNSFDVNEGLYMARELLIYLNSINMPCGCEFLDTITPHYISDLISWGAIGARTTESQVHRQLVSGLSMAIGFKNNTSGDINICIDAIKSANSSHCFMGINDTGMACIIKTNGNNNTHIILRGSNNGPNYTKIYVENYKKQINSKLMIDCSHGNSNKDYKNQPAVFYDVINQIKNGETSIIGIMLESNINEGKQSLDIGKNKLKMGVSITDSCINIQTTDELLNKAYYLL